MKFLNFIIEGEGITNRKAGDIFVDQHDNLYKFQELIKEPLTGNKEFHIIQDLDKDVANQVEITMKKLGAKEKTIHANNQKTPRTKSYMMMVLIDQKKNTPVFVIRYYDRPMDNQVKWPSPELKKMKELSLSLARSTSLKTEVMSGIIQVSKIFDDTKMSGKDLINKTEDAFNKEQKPIQKQILGAFLELLKDIYVGGRNKYILKGMKKYQNVFDVSLAEAIIPMALLEISKGKNKSLFSGDSISNLEKCIGVPYSGFGSLKVLIPTKSNEKLIDSVIYNGSEKLFGISNKAGKGAAASITNIMDGVNKIKNDDPKHHKELMKQFPEELKILEIIASRENSMQMGALLVAKEMGIINDAEVKQALDVYKNDNTKGISKNLSKLLSSTESNSHLSGYTRGNHLITGIAKEVARKANSDTKYMELIKKILISAKFVQASPTFTSSGTDDLVLSSIKLIWPPVVKSVKVDANKNFSATKIRGKLSFIVH